MVSYLFGLESMAYLTCGLVDAGVEDYSLESAICKVSGTEFLWYAANRAFQLHGGSAYMKDNPLEKVLRDIRIFPIFEGANDVMRAFIALTGVKPVGERLSGLGDIGLSDPIRSIGVLADYVAGRIRSEVAGPDHAGAPRAVTARRRRIGPGRAAPFDHRGPPARAPQGDPVPAVPPEAPGRRDRRHLRPGRGALAGDVDLRGPGRPALRPGALHRRDVLRARRAARPLELRPDRGERRRPHDRHREAGVQAWQYGYELFD